MHTKQIISIFYAIVFFTGSVAAGQDEIQKRFNAETINRSFSVPADAELTKALSDATKRGQPMHQSRGIPGGCVGPGCMGGQNYGYGGYFGGYARPYYGGFYGINSYVPYYYGW